MRFIVKKRNIHVGSSPGEKFVLVPDKGETIKFDKLADVIGQMSTVHRSDAKATLDVLGAAMVFYLSEGHSVKVNGLGTFYPKIRTKSEDELEELGATNIQSISIGFTPSVELRNKMKSVPINIKPYEGD